MLVSKMWMIYKPISYIKIIYAFKIINYRSLTGPTHFMIPRLTDDITSYPNYIQFLFPSFSLLTLLCVGQCWQLAVLLWKLPCRQAGQKEKAVFRKGGWSVAPHAAHVYDKYYGQKEILLRAYKSRHSRVFRCFISSWGFNHRLLMVSLIASTDRLNFSINNGGFQHLKKY